MSDHQFLRNTFLLFFVCLLAEVSAAEPREISYTLPKDGKVSLAIYNAEGQMVRTLRNASTQKAGQQTVVWDGLDQDGKAVPAGEYSWKLLLSQGMKAEYLLSLGTSVGEQYWTGGDAGPLAVAVLDNGNIIACGVTEGAPMLSSLDPTTNKVPWVTDIWGSKGTIDITVMDGVLYALSGRGALLAYDAKTGQRLVGEDGVTAKVVPFNPVMADLGPIELSSESKSFPFPGTPNGYFRLRGKITGDPGLKIQMPGIALPMPQLKSGKEVEVSFPDREGLLTAKPIKEIKVALSGPASEWSASSLEILGVASRVSSADGLLVGIFPVGDRVVWIDPAGKTVAEASAANPKDIAAVDATTALVLSDGNVVELNREARDHKVLVSGLDSPTAVGFDRATGKIFVAEGGKVQQVKRFSRTGKLEATFGQPGGRKTGKYIADNFLGMSDVSGDGRGGFWVTEAESAPRRTAHFDANGKLLGEWMGGQPYFTFAAPEPDNADVFWMDSHWGWLMQVQADYDKRTWKVLATYRWGADHIPGLFFTYKMNRRHAAHRLDLDKDGQKETYLSGEAGLVKVDEAAGKLRLVSTLGMANANAGTEWHKIPLEKQPKPWLDAITLLGEDPAKVYRSYRGFAWTDLNGDDQFQAEEFRLTKLGGESMGGFQLLDDLSVIKNSGWDAVNWLRFPPQGYTDKGYPIWDWSKSEPAPINSSLSTADVLFAPDGDIYQITRGGGDGFVGLDTWALGYGYNWPANLTDATGVRKWTADGKLIWTVGSMASRGKEGTRGRLNFPVHFAGLVNGTVGVCDRVVQPVAFWTEDGLYAGELLDRRADDGLPPRMYAWGQASSDDFNPQTGRAGFQFDMGLGGSLVKRPNGEVIFVGAGFNYCPVYRVTGWDEFERLEGTVNVAAPASESPQNGSGLKGEFFANPKWEGNPVMAAITPRIWFEPARGAKQRPPTKNWNWPDNGSKAATPSLDSVLDGPGETKAPTPSVPFLAGPSSARWTGWIEPRFTEAYTFGIYRKEGNARLWIGGKLVAGPFTQERVFKLYSAPIALEAGKKYPIKLEWAGPRGGGELHLVWESLSQPISHVPKEALFEAGGPDLATVSLKRGIPRAPRSPGPKPVAEWTLSRTGAAKSALDVRIGWSGNAEAGTDYVALPKIVTFKPGQTEVKIPLLTLSGQTQASVELIGEVGVSSDYQLDGTRGVDRMMISDPERQRIEGVSVTGEFGKTRPGSFKPNFNESGLVNLVNRSGLDESADPPTHDGAIQNAWYGEHVGGIQLTFDLGKDYNVSELHLWNLNTPGAPGPGWRGESVSSGVSQVKIQVAKSAEGPWEDLSTVRLRIPAGNSSDPGQSIPVDRTTRFVRLLPEGAWTTGLAEIAFYGKPAKP